ncbi:PQQ-binding-like beta-propeller repeat protein [Nonomuraea sp. NPDC050663]|uniref:outer membrane protein assembly factor BamB family protein n=1 Tax=Nonomuraea sp. NPDC050663 TaxID=3364370 RepID=UPI0037BB629D
MLRAKPAIALAGMLALAACSGSDAATAEFPTWQNNEVNAISRMVTGGGIVTLTSMKTDGSLETVALDQSSGKRLWAFPTTMAGRLPGMGVSPPAIVETGKDQAVVAALDPLKKGRWNALLIARDGRTGKQKWTRPVHSTFGPQRCGSYICLSEHTALRTARVVVLDPADGKTRWTLPGIAEVEWADASRVLFLRLAANPMIESYDIRTGKIQWQQPIEQALGKGIDMSGGWAFGATGDDLVGYVAPYTNPRSRRVSTFGLFSVKLTDGSINWMRPSVVRVYPSGNPGFAPIVRPVDQQGQYGGFARLEAESGRVVGQITAGQVPGSGWWLAFPDAMDRLGFLKHNTKGSTFDLATGKQLPIEEAKGWSFCVTDPKPLQLRQQIPGFYSTAALCRYDLATGKKLTEAASAPPAWFTGSQGGWRLWRDEKGAVHGVKDGSADAPGMYG